MVGVTSSKVLSSLFAVFSRLNLAVSVLKLLVDDILIVLFSVALPAWSKKGKFFPYSLPSVGPAADPRVQAVSPQVIHPAVGCHYFPPGP